jgi:hypothetical protein
VKAIHDMYYATQPASFTELLWRLQVIAELGVGRLLRREQQSEQEAAEAILGKVS